MMLRLKNWLTFRLERAMVRGPLAQLAVIAGLILLVSLSFGMLILLISPDVGSAGEAVWWSFLRLTDPGFLGEDEGAGKRIVSLLLTLCGFLLFTGSLVAILVQWLVGTMRRLELGLTPVALENHIVILGWTSRSAGILKELMVAQGRVKRFLRGVGARRLRVALLAEEADAVLSQEIRERLAQHWKGNGIILRSGSPLRLEHLNRVDVGHAAAILIPAADTVLGDPLDADTQTIKALLTLGGVFRDQPPGELPRLVAEIQDLRQVGAVRSLYQGPLEVIASDQLISRLIAKNLRNPGLSHVFAELLGDAGGSQIYVTEAPALRGMPIRQLAGAFPAAVLLGIARPAEGGFRALLNPARDLRMEAGDAVVLLARSGQDLAPQTAFTPPAGLPEPVAPPARKSARRRVLVLGWSHRVPALLSELAGSGKEQFSVDLVSTVPPSQREAEIAEHDLPEGRIRVKHLQFDYTSPSHLRSTGPEDYDNLVLLASERLEAGPETDSRTILGCLLLRELVPVGAAPQVLVELTDPENVPLLEGRAGEVILSPVIISNLLARVALRRELSAVFDALFGAEGSEIFFRPLGDYGLEPGEYTFVDLQRASDLRGEIAIGLRQPGEEAPFDGGVRLNPGREERLQLGAGAQLIVLGARA